MSEHGRPERDKAGHRFTQLVSEAIAAIQVKIVDLEVEIRIAEDACSYYSECIEIAKEESRTLPNNMDRIKAEKDVVRYEHLLEEAEVKCDELERRQLYYKLQLDDRTTLPVY